MGLPQKVEHWSLTTLRDKLIKIGAKVAQHGRCVAFQLAEVAAPRNLFREMPRPLDRNRDFNGGLGDRIPDHCEL